MELGDLFLQFVERYHQVLVEADGAGTAKAGTPDITISQFFYLQCIRRNENITLTGLATKTGVSKPSANAAITRLLNDGLITRTRSAVDQRKYHLTLSRKGHRIFAQKDRAYRRFVEQLLKNTTEEEQQIVFEALRIMIEYSPDPEQ